MTSDINDICKLSRLGQFKMFNCLEMVKVNTSVIFFGMYLQSIRSITFNYTSSLFFFTGLLKFNLLGRTRAGSNKMSKKTCWM